MTDLDELERLHAGLPVLRAETWNHEDGEGHAAIIAVLEPDCDDDDDEHPGAYDAAVAGVRLLNALPGLLAELRALRSVAEAARPFVPTCDEDVLSDENGHGLACGKVATHHSRMGGNQIGYLCDEHTASAHAAAKRAASKGWFKAIDGDSPVTFDVDPVVRDLATALAKVPNPEETP
jgi:hypothetical protein